MLVTWTTPEGKFCNTEEINGWGMHQYEFFFFFFFTCCQALYNNTSVWKKKFKINNDNHYHKLNLNHNHNHSHNNHNHKIWHLLILLSYCVGLRYVHQCRELCKIKTQSIYIFFPGSPSEWCGCLSLWKQKPIKSEFSSRRYHHAAWCQVGTELTNF